MFNQLWEGSSSSSIWDSASTFLIVNIHLNLKSFIFNLYLSFSSFFFFFLINCFFSKSSGSRTAADKDGTVESNLLHIMLLPLIDGVQLSSGAPWAGPLQCWGTDLPLGQSVDFYFPCRLSVSTLSINAFMISPLLISVLGMDHSSRSGEVSQALVICTSINVGLLLIRSRCHIVNRFLIIPAGWSIFLFELSPDSCKPA